MPHRSRSTPSSSPPTSSTGLQRIVSREIDPVEPAVITIGAINGGTTYNVIPPRVALKGTVRTFSAATRDSMEGRIRRIAEHTCAAGDATCALDWHPSYPVTANDPGRSGVRARGARARVRAARVRRSRRSWAAKTSRTSRTDPGVFLVPGRRRRDAHVPNHHPAFDIDEKAMITGIAAHATSRSGSARRRLVDDERSRGGLAACSVLSAAHRGADRAVRVEQFGHAVADLLPGGLVDRAAQNVRNLRVVVDQVEHRPDLAADLVRVRDDDVDRAPRRAGVELGTGQRLTLFRSRPVLVELEMRRGRDRSPAAGRRPARSPSR